jgi:drug/metabolite transporter (DMT)-like permease
MAVIAALLWASYYYFVLKAGPAAPPSALLAWPFLIGGAFYAGWAAVRGELGALAREFRDRAAWARVGLLLAMQLSVLGSTYLAGAIDTSLLNLVGDVVLTPLLVMLFFAEGRERLRSPVFLGGLGLSLAGASLAILAGGTARSLSGLGFAVGLVLPFSVALFFVFAARASRLAPNSAIMGHAFLVGGLISLLLSPWVPGGAAGLLLLPGKGWAIVLALGLTSFFLANVLYFRAIETAGLILPSVLMSTIPIFALALSYALLGTGPTVLGLIGIPVAVWGAFLALQGSHPPWSRVEPAERAPERPSADPGE